MAPAGLRIKHSSTTSQVFKLEGQVGREESRTHGNIHLNSATLRAVLWQVLRGQFLACAWLLHLAVHLEVEHPPLEEQVAHRATETEVLRYTT